MKLSANELIRLLLTKEHMTQKELVVLISEKTGKTCAQSGLSRKLNKGTITFNEVMTILDILGYEIDLKNKS
ncbi:hypothetical protein IKA15_04005 [bacterium]|nr:hypothetical protein [bacterium]